MQSDSLAGPFPPSDPISVATDCDNFLGWPDSKSSASFCGRFVDNFALPVPRQVGLLTAWSST